MSEPVTAISGSFSCDGSQEAGRSTPAACAIDLRIVGCFGFNLSQHSQLQQSG